MLLRRTWGSLLTGLRCRMYRECRRTAHSSHDDDRDIDGPKGTHLNFLNDPDTEHPHLYINKYSVDGFTLSTGIELQGSVVFFPRSFITWKVNNVDEINAESLSLFKAIHPKLDILIIGTGTNKRTISKDVIKYLRENRINFEILPTEKAIPTFNFLSAEQRWVAAALIPPDNIVDSLSRDIKDHLESVEQKALLEADDDDDDIKLLEDKTIEKKGMKGVDHHFLDTFAEERKDTNVFGYKIGYTPMDVEVPTKPGESLAQPVTRTSESGGSIRYIRKSDSQLDQKEIEDSKDVFIVRSPLEMSRQYQTDVTDEASDIGKEVYKVVDETDDIDSIDKTGPKK